MIATGIYNAGIQLYKAAVQVVAATGNAKAKRWLEGRKGLLQHLRESGIGATPVVWIHAASLGEFEQGRPVLEAIRQQFPYYKILLTFFSPSGYEVRKGYKNADYVYYLPLDTPRNAREFLNIVQPKLAIFIKYEFWYHYLTALHAQQVPTLLISGIFRKSQPFFKPWGGMFRQLLEQMTHIFVQNQPSLQYLQEINIQQVTLAGDTRFDRVWALRQEIVDIPLVTAFCGNKKVVVAGSTWEDDEKLLAAWQQQEDTCLVIAPHEIHATHIQSIMTLFPNAIRYTELAAGTPLTGQRVLIVDNVGMLSALYRYATVTYVGGGFGREGIHNILEPATYSKPVLFGPIFDKFPEAQELLDLGGAFVVNNEAELSQQLQILLQQESVCYQVGQIAGKYVSDNKGATSKILAYIQEKRFLTSE
jgi:3-deoxy-D-manno-octulosonic-acid transferase